MRNTHRNHWPAGLPQSLSVPQTSIFANLEISCRRFPERTALVYYDTATSYSRLYSETLALAGWLQQVGSVQRGDRVLLCMQNSPQFVVAYYAILRADAVVVPVNPMLTSGELEYIATDSGARMAIVAQEVLPAFDPLVGAPSRSPLQSILVATYSDALRSETTLEVPAFVSAPRGDLFTPNVFAWHQALSSNLSPQPHLSEPQDIAVLPYTSGTTGQPKGCIHTHHNVMHTAVAGPLWTGGIYPDAVALTIVPMFHVMGMQTCMNALIYCGGAIVILPRWNRETAGELITRYCVTHWVNIPTMIIDLLASPRFGEFDISSLRQISGGGTAMPAAVAQRLYDLTGQRYIEGYGMTETMGTTHCNPIHRPKQQCLGLPTFGVRALVIDPESVVERSPSEVGEILISGPQVFRGYWNDEAKSTEAFVRIDGVQYLRTGDLGYVDEDGYFFFVDRLKRMINASGFKVWPAEVESMLYNHVEIQECCVIASPDAYRGETVKALVVLKPNSSLGAEDIAAWARDNMASYKAPRIVDLVSSLPKTASGKVLWRVLQEEERARALTIGREAD